ncbi:MAG: hypothetical protein WC467_02265 [Patescibacteria group bacterium]
METEIQIEKIIAKLNGKAIISYAYLLIAIALVAATLIPAQYTGSIYYLQTTTTGYSSETSIGWPATFLWMAAVMYLGHFIYGAIYFPLKYKRLLKNKYSPEIDDSDNDNSFYRGVIPAIIVGIIYIYFIKEDANLLESGRAYEYWIALVAWIIVNVILTLSTTTEFMFNNASFRIDQMVLAPWQYEEPKKGEHDYIDVYYCSPVGVDEKSWKSLVAVAYAKYLSEHKKEDEENYQDEEDKEKIDQFSQLIANKASR